MSDVISLVLISVLPVIFGITLHEAAHGYVARLLGDPTATALGRVTLNPIRHIDPVGSIVVPVAMLALTAGNFVMGWAKPVPINPNLLRHPRRDMVWVALAGPGSNLLMAIFWILALKGVLPADGMTLSSSVMNGIGNTAEQGGLAGQFMAEMAQVGITVNLVLLVLNLLPLPPLDGGRVLVGILPWTWAHKVASLENWGMPILLLLAITGVLGAILGPLVALLWFILSRLFL